MHISMTINGKTVSDHIEPNTTLYDFVRAHGCYSVKCGCETSCCGLCTVLLNDTPVLSCSVFAARLEGASVVTLEGLQDEAAEFGQFLAEQLQNNAVSAIPA